MNSCACRLRKKERIFKKSLQQDIVVENYWLLRAGSPCNRLGRPSDWTEQLFCLTFRLSSRVSPNKRRDEGLPQAGG